jgi:glycosyltransferase involved in cell wall biosynthesis
VYDRVVVAHGGAERVVRAVHALFPKATVFTSVADTHCARWARRMTLRTSWLQHIPFIAQRYRYAVPFMPLAFESLDLRPFELVVSISSAEAKGVLTQPHQLHVCYILTPSRYLWHQSREYTRGIFRWVRHIGFTYLRWWDRVAAARPDHIIAISHTVANRVRRTYRREVDAVIYPTIFHRRLVRPSRHRFKRTLDVVRQQPFLLCVGRLVPSKHFEIALYVAAQLQLPITIIGQGPEQRALQRIAQRLGVQVEWRVALSDTQLMQYYQRAKLVLHPGIEDFGLVPIEAARLGTPIVLHKHSGATELLRSHHSVAAVSTYDPDAWVRATRRLLNQGKRTEHRRLSLAKSLLKYDTVRFQRQFGVQLRRFWQAHQASLKGSHGTQ